MMRQSALDLPPGPCPNVVDTLSFEHRIEVVMPRIVSYLLTYWSDWHDHGYSCPDIEDRVEWAMDQSKGAHQIAYTDHYETFTDLTLPDGLGELKLPTGHHVVTFAFERQEDAVLFRMFWS